MSITDIIHKTPKVYQLKMFFLSHLQLGCHLLEGLNPFHLFLTFLLSQSIAQHLLCLTVPQNVMSAQGDSLLTPNS